MSSVFMLSRCHMFPAIVDTETSTEVVQYHLKVTFFTYFVTRNHIMEEMNKTEKGKIKIRYKYYK